MPCGPVGCRDATHCPRRWPCLRDSLALGECAGSMQVALRRWGVFYGAGGAGGEGTPRSGVMDGCKVRVLARPCWPLPGGMIVGVRERGGTAPDLLVRPACGRGRASSALCFHVCSGLIGVVDGCNCGGAEAQEDMHGPAIDIGGETADLAGQRDAPGVVADIVCGVGDALLDEQTWSTPFSINQRQLRAAHGGVMARVFSEQPALAALRRWLNF